MEYLKIFTELIQGVIWPVSLMSALYYFRTEIKERFPYIKKISPTGVELTQQKSLELSLETKTASSNMLSDRKKTTLIRKIELKIQADLNEIKPDKQVGILINNLAISRIAHDCQRVNSMIFGSQVKLLQQLEENGGSLPMKAAKKIFLRAKIDYEDFYGDSKFSQWFNFLETNQLATLDGKQITSDEFTADLLAFLRANGLAKNKLY